MAEHINAEGLYSTDPCAWPFGPMELFSVTSRLLALRIAAPCGTIRHKSDTKHGCRGGTNGTEDTWTAHGAAGRHRPAEAWPGRWLPRRWRQFDFAVPAR